MLRSAAGHLLSSRETSSEHHGRGFDLDEVMRSRDDERGLYFLGMQARAEFLGGVLSLKSHPGLRLEIGIQIPIIQEAPDV